MTLVEAWVHTRLASAIGWTIFHSVWEGAVISLALALALSLIRPAALRYVAACAALFLLLAVSGATFLRVLPGPVDVVRIERSQAFPSSNGSLETADPGSTPRLASVLPWLSPAWLAGVWIFCMRHLADSLAVRRLRRTGVCCAPELWQDRLAALLRRVGVTVPVLLLESCLARVPVVIGHLRPLILMPVGLLAGLPASQIEAILLHELAHIRRRDYLVNVVQRLAEGLLFYHPAVWWISGIIRAERENCCDDLAVAVHGDAHAYALALEALEQNKGKTYGSHRRGAPCDTNAPTRDKGGSFPLLPVAATGGSLVERIRRLIDPQTRSAAISPFFSAAILAATAAVALAAWPSDPPRPATRQVNPEESRYLRWLNEDVVYIIADAERIALLRLTTDEEREKFIEQFWLRRDPTPGTPRNEFKEEHYRRIAYANKRFASGIVGWRTDRGRIYILYGPPDEIESNPTGGPGRLPSETWLYRHIDGIGDRVTVLFVDRTGRGDLQIAPGPGER